MAKRTGRAKPMSPKAGIKRGRYGNGGKHEFGLKELSWSKSELDEFVKK